MIGHGLRLGLGRGWVKRRSSFSPSDIAGYRCDFDANQVTLDSGAVVEWPDLSGSGFDLDQIIGTPYPPHEASVFGEHAAAHFGGGVLYENGATVFAEDGFTFFAILQFDTVAAFNPLFGSETNVAPYRGGFGVWSDGKPTIYNGAGVALSASTPLLADTPTIFVARVAANGDWLVRANGPANTGSGNEALFDGSGFDHIAIGGAASQPGSGYVGRLIGYNAALTTEDIEAVEAYLSSAYEIALA